mgnify:FL=1
MTPEEFYSRFTQDEEYAQGVIENLKNDAQEILDGGGEFQDVYWMIYDDIVAAPIGNVHSYFSVLVTGIVMDKIVAEEASGGSNEE